MAFSPPRIPAHVARGAASEEGEETSFSAFFSAVHLHPPFCSLRLALGFVVASTDPSCCLFSECLGWPCMQTDKASMLDEIIDYVKFLQLQVKASMKC
jgi:hypothetical protein